MPSSPDRPAPPPGAARLAAAHRLAATLFLGFASGLPLALTGQAFQAWLTTAGIDLATLGFLALVGLPYTFKFLWAPLMDRFEPPGLGRRRGWLVATQLALAAALGLLSTLSPTSQLTWIGLGAASIAFLSASQDVVLDAWRTDVMSPSERGAAASLGVLGYRLAMVLSGGIAMIWADPVVGGWTWPEVYRAMAAIMAACAVVSAVFVPRLPPELSGPPERTEAKGELLGFVAVLAAAAVGWLVARYPATWAGDALVAAVGVREDLRSGWSGLFSIAAGLGVALPLGRRLSVGVGYATLNRSLASFFAQPGAVTFLVLIVLYKLGDAFAGALLTPFLLKGVGYSQAEIGVVNKVFGLWLSILGALLGGALLAPLRLYRALFLFAVLQMASNLGFYALAVVGRGAWGGFELPPFDLGIVWLKEAATVDWGLLAAVAAENLTGGMGTAAFVALLMALSQKRFSATQYALLSALSAVGRVWVGPLAGVLVEGVGWPTFFLLSLVAAVPGIVLLVRLRGQLRALETA